MLYTWQPPDIKWPNAETTTAVYNSDPGLFTTVTCLIIIGEDGYVIGSGTLRNLIHGQQVNWETRKKSISAKVFHGASSFCEALGASHQNLLLHISLERASATPESTEEVSRIWIHQSCSHSCHLVGHGLAQQVRRVLCFVGVQASHHAKHIATSHFFIRFCSLQKVKDLNHWLHPSFRWSWTCSCEQVQPPLLCLFPFDSTVPWKGIEKQLPLPFLHEFALLQLWIQRIIQRMDQKLHAWVNEGLGFNLEIKCLTSLDWIISWFH